MVPDTRVFTGKLQAQRLSGYPCEPLDGIVPPMSSTTLAPTGAYSKPMLLKTITKLLFKATLPLIAISGVLTYAAYLQGVDTGAIWKKVGSGLGAQFSESIASARQGAGSALSRVSDRSTTLGSALSLSSSQRPGQGAGQLFKWVDSNGVTHYGSEPPAGIDAQRMQINSDMNVVASLPTTRAKSSADLSREKPGVQARSGSESSNNMELRDTQGFNSAAVSKAVADLEAQTGESLPGIAGQLLSGSSDVTGAASKLNPSELVRLLQPGSH